jgi:hypothetical protein
MLYYLYPPFFHVPEQSNFPDAWESFCCKLLNLAKGTNEIYVRTAPEQGIDLYFPSKNIAYQCKSVESGKSGEFSSSKAIESLEAAKLARKDLGWKKYAICTNVNVSGIAERKLRSELRLLQIYPSSYWQRLCEKYPTEVNRNFRIVLDIPLQNPASLGTHPIVKHYSKKLKSKVGRGCYEVFLYSRGDDRLYLMPVCSSVTVQELLRVLRAFFNLPNGATVSTNGVQATLRHYIIVNGKEAAKTRTLRQLGVRANDVLMLGTHVSWNTPKAEFKSEILNIDDGEDRVIVSQLGSLNSESFRRAEAEFEKELRTAFRNIDQYLREV